jgi:hypothetical protein
VRVLLDENIAHALRFALGQFETATVQYKGFGGLKNGDVLNAAEAGGFDVSSRATKPWSMNRTSRSAGSPSYRFRPRIGV